MRGLSFKTLGAVFFLGSFSLLVTVSGCSSQAGIGESCETKGATTTECVDGAVCEANATGAPVCLKLCTVQTDCASNEACNGVSGGSLHACQPK